MGKGLLPIGVIFSVILSGVCHGRGDVHRFDLPSEAVGVTYTIEVVLPTGAAESGLTYPVVYCTDWFVLADYLQSLPPLMDMGHLTESFILVGISHEGDMNDWAMARTRDFTPARPTDEFSLEHTYSPALDLTGGASRFATFLATEAIPRVESDYPIDPTRRGFLGYSLGALFGVHVLVNDPDLFQYYLLGSPSVWFDAYGLASELEAVTGDRLRSIERIYLSVGSEESSEMLNGFGIVRDALLEKGFEGTRSKMEIIDEAGHVGAMPIALYNGLRFLFQRP